MQHTLFEWHGSHPATSFTNTLHTRRAIKPQERLLNYRALLDFTQQAQLLDAQTAHTLAAQATSVQSEEVWAKAIQLREALAATLQALIAKRTPKSADLNLIDRLIHQAGAARQLLPGPDGFRWEWRNPLAPERPLWELALSVEQLLTTAPAERIKQCDGPNCGRLFLDDSRTGARRWCSMATCGNRNKVQRFRAALKELNQ